MKDNDLDLMDRVHGLTFLRKPYARLRVGNDATMRVQQFMRTKLRQAERFVLDDDAVRTVCHLAREFKRMEGWSFLARLPYDSLWFEFDLHTKVREFEKMGTLGEPFVASQVPSRMGLLMYREAPDTNSPRWICHDFVIDIHGDAVGGMLSYVFDPEGDFKFPIRGSSVWNSPTLSLRPGFPKFHWTTTEGGVVAGIGQPARSARFDIDPEVVIAGIYDWYDTAEFPIENYDQLKGLIKDGKVKMSDLHAKAPAWLLPRMAMIVDPWYDAYLDYKPSAEIMQGMLNDCRENSGHLRWIISMLAAINGLPKSIKTRHFRPGKRTVGMNMLPFLRSSTISLSIPREDRPFAILADKLDRVANKDPVRRAAHNVIGHWRVTERGKVRFICRHDPVEMEPGLGICRKCELIVRWIKPVYGRGDASVGVVTHDKYAVTA